MKGIIEGKVTKGTYKGKKVEIVIGERCIDSHIEINGKSIDEMVESVHIHVDANKEPSRFEIKMIGPEEG